MSDIGKEIDCTNSSFQEKEDLFGKGFGLINVISFEVIDGSMYTKVILDGNEVVLVGDPEKALHNYMLGSNKGEKQ